METIHVEDQVAGRCFRVEPEQQVEPQQRAGNDEVLPDIKGQRLGDAVAAEPMHQPE